MNARTVIRILIGVVVVVAALWYVLSLANIDQMMAIMSHAAALPLLASIPIILASHVMRARRWKTLLTPRQPNVSMWTGFSAIMIGYAANTIVPRVGEILRPWVFSRRERIPMSTAVSSVVVERVLDVFTLLIGILLVVVIERDHVTQAIPQFSPQLILTTLVLPVVLIVVLASIMIFTPAGQWVIDHVLTRMHARLGAFASRIYANVHEGVAVIKAPSLWLRLAVESVVIWALYILPLWLALQSITFSVPMTFSIGDAAVLLVIISIGVTIAPTPGALGIYQGFAQLALVRIYHATPDEGLAFGILAWVVNYGVSLLVGGTCWIIEVRRGLSWRDVRGTVSL